MVLHGNRELNHTPWPPYLYVYDDLLVYRKRKFFRLKEVTMAYSHIVRIDLERGLFFATLNIFTHAHEHITVKFIGKKDAIKAKKIIDQKIYSASKHKGEEEKVSSISLDYERSLGRLNELLNRGKLTKKEYSRKKADLLKKLR